jgi:hypothetical protein
MGTLRPEPVQQMVVAPVASSAASGASRLGSVRGVPGSLVGGMFDDPRQEPPTCRNGPDDSRYKAVDGGFPLRS